MGRRGWAIWVVVVVCGGAACGSGKSRSTSSRASTAASSPATTQAPAPTPTTAGHVAKATPAAGTGNVQGSVVFDEKPAVGVNVTLCEKFDQFGDGCSGQQYKAQTAADGSYVIANVPPMTYAALTVDVFDTNSYVYAQSDLLTPQTYTVTAGQTLFADRTYLYKSDLQLVAPAAGATVAAGPLTITWQAYADAAYYKVSVTTSDSSPDPVTDERVSGTSYAVSSPLAAGTYGLQVEAYDAKDHKLSQSGDNINFTVK